MRKILDFNMKYCYICIISQERIFYFINKLRAMSSTSLDIILSWLIRASCPFFCRRLEMFKKGYKQTDEHKRKICEANIKHGHVKNGKETKTYTSWINMRQRCNNPNNDRYEYYGGRGIKICERWNSFENFFADMGEITKGLTLERIDNDGNYEPSNCRLATHSEQGRNTRANKLSMEKVKEIRRLFFGGCSQRKIARQFNISHTMVACIINRKSWLGK